MTDEEIKELIFRRRKQIWVHSILYYQMNVKLISDVTLSELALELEILQKKYPELSKSVLYYDIFKDFNHYAVSDLPLNDPIMTAKAQLLLDARMALTELIF